MHPQLWNWYFLKKVCTVHRVLQYCIFISLIFHVKIVNYWAVLSGLRLQLISISKIVILTNFMSGALHYPFCLQRICITFFFPFLVSKNSTLRNEIWIFHPFSKFSHLAMYVHNLMGTIDILQTKAKMVFRVQVFLYFQWCKFYSDGISGLGEKKKIYFWRNQLS